MVDISQECNANERANVTFSPIPVIPPFYGPNYALKNKKHDLQTMVSRRIFFWNWKMGSKGATTCCKVEYGLVVQ